MLYEDADKLKTIYKELLGFTPLPKQEAVLFSQERFNVFVGGVGAGKSLTAAHYAWPRCLLPSILPTLPKATYWLVAENYVLPRMEWNYIRQAYGELGIPVKTSTPRDGSWIIRLPHSTIETKSWSNEDSLHGVPVQGMLVCEAGLLPPELWYTRLEPRLSRIPGHSWCFLSGTLEDSGFFYKDLVRRVVIEDSMPGWFGTSMATWENTHVYEKGMEDPEIQRLLLNTPNDIFMERYGAVPKTVGGLVYREFQIAHHVQDFAWDKHRPVYLCIDPGRIYALNALQKQDDLLYVIDEIHIEGGSTEDVITEAVKRPWWPNVRFGVIDIMAREPKITWSGDGASSAIWKQVGQSPIPMRSQKVAIDDGIEAVRMKLHSPVFDPDDTLPSDIWDFDGRPGIAKLFVHPRCQELIKEMSQNYKYKKIKSGEYSPGVHKLHDHHCNALAYGVIELYGYAPQPASQPITWRDSRPIKIW